MAEQLGLGLYYGVFAAILLLNSLLFLSTRDRVSLYCAEFLIALGLMHSVITGILDFYFKSGFQFARFLFWLSVLTLLTGHQFTRIFLKSRELMPKLDRVQLGLMTVAGSIAFIALTPLFRPHLVELGHLIAWGAFIFMIAFYFSATYGLIPGGTFVPYTVQVGSLLEMILLSLGLAHQVDSRRNAKLEAEVKARHTDTLRSLVHIICHDLTLLQS